ncbi:MAG: hypothetical protein PHU14_09070 [Methylovulum sp.]|nr:hypothetical protein [Methylovulum sp.]
MNNLETLLLESNEVLRSAYQIAARSGRDTNWDAFINTVSCCLDHQHQLTNELRKRAAEENLEAVAASTNSQSLVISALRDLIHSLDMGTDVTINAAVYKANEVLKQAGV